MTPALTHAPEFARTRGFTLLELLIVCAIAAILAAVALPNLRGLIVTSRVKTAASDLHASLTLARSEAIKRNANVDVVPASAANWAQGWSVRVGGAVLEQQQAYESITFTGPAATVTYTGSGRLSGASSLTFTMSTATNASVQARCVYVDPSGRPAVRTDRNHNASDGCN